jgi:hypothetical protein
VALIEAGLRSSASASLVAVEPSPALHWLGADCDVRLAGLR